jgi:hypothetical protein
MLISRIAALLGGAGSSFGVLGGLLESPPLTHYDSTRRPCHLPQRQSPLLPPITGQEWDTLGYLATLGEWSQLAT